ncbi:hypothetical protein [Thalassoporum mexicanum]|nr:hypothetical protein [Pseudanabaena sp. PCC 7367]
MAEISLTNCMIVKSSHQCATPNNLVLRSSEFMMENRHLNDREYS